MKIHINKTNKNKTCYIKLIEDYVAKQTRDGNVVELFYYKILSSTIIKQCFYSNPVEKWNKDIALAESEFFSKHAKYLFSIVKSKANDGGVGNVTNSWNNLILYGPGGTGKSSFIYRTAMLLKLSIVSVDLSLYLNKKKELYRLFHGHEFLLPNSSENAAREPAIPNGIIVLEEFDFAVAKIQEIEEIFMYKEKIMKQYLEMRNEEIRKKSQELLRSKIEDTSKETDYEKFLREENENATVFAKAKKTVVNKLDFENQIHNINADLNNMIRSMDEDNKSSILRLSDLLELFQGPVPIKNRLIIATTNNFDKIRTALPTLFRAGRMTPIHFDYLDNESFDALCTHYFKKTCTSKPKKINIPTSQIIELAIKTLLTNKGIDTFEKEFHVVNDELGFIPQV
jgi:hypothetical protein